MKFDDETCGKRKLSKRKYPELSLDYYRQDGYHPYCMKVYLMTLLNSNFEEWHEQFPDKDINEFPFSIEKMIQSGALFARMNFQSFQRMNFMISFTIGRQKMHLKRRIYGLPIKKKCLQY